MSSNPLVERTFMKLHQLLTGRHRFTLSDLRFMERYLDEALKSTRKLIARAEGQDDDRTPAEGTEDRSESTGTAS